MVIMNTQDILSQDKNLTAEQLDNKYNPDGDGEHPHVTRFSWMEAVMNQDTLVGYWEWVKWVIHTELTDQNNHGT